MSPSVPINTSYRDQLIIGVAIGIWLYLFLAIIGPFDAATLSFWIRIELMIGYGLVFCASYLVCIPMQNAWFERFKEWHTLNEIILLLLFSVICLFTSYRYYITDWVRGDYGFFRFLLEIYLPTLVIIIPALIFARRFVARKRNSSQPTQQIQLYGTNKHDILQLSLEQLIALSASNNYVTVYYLQAGSLRKKLLRTPLKKLQEELPELIQVHRSHLVNPLHFQEWRDGSTIALTQIDLPVSKTFKSRILSAGLFVPK